MRPDLEKIWVPMGSGRVFFPFAPQADDIHLPDIARGLARQCRYGGQTERYYSVAEHSLILARYFHHKGCPVNVCLAALLHDAAEAYVGDIRRPIKALAPELEQYEMVILDMIMQHCGVEVTREEWQMIMRADTDIIYNEYISLFPEIGRWRFDSIGLVLAMPIKGMDPYWAEREWLAMAESWMREMRTTKEAV